MSIKTDVIRRYFDELFNRGRLEVVDELLAPDYVNHSPGSPEQPRGREGVKQVVAALRAAFPDLHYSIDELIEGSDAVAVRTTMTGTHRGDLFGLPPTGRSITVAQITLERFRGDQIIAHHRLTDELGMMRQLGVIAS